MTNEKRLEIALSSLVSEGMDDQKIADLVLRTLVRIRSSTPKEHGGSKVMLSGTAHGKSKAKYL